MAVDKTTPKTENDKAKEAGARIVNQNATVSSGFSVPERIWNFLCNEKNIGSITTAAIMGNIAQESNYNTKADSSAFDGNASIGLCQWTFGRKTALINFAQSQGKDVSDVDVQLNFLWQELGQRGDITTTKNASQGMPESTKEQIYAKIRTETKKFCDVFEIPDPKYANYENRYNRAIEAYEKQGKGVLSAGNYVPGNTPGAGFMGQASAAKRGTTQDRVAVEEIGHKDEWIVKPLDPDKTFCEPVYPDLTSIGEEIPAYSMPNNIPTADRKLVDYNAAGAGLVWEIPTSAAIKFADDKNLANYIVQNQAIANQRKEVFQKAMQRSAFKTPTAGKPPNNKDPFPVDHKIVELETHQPRCKIEQVYACHHSIDVAKAVVLLSTDTEKRLVRLENNMATMLRYLYRMAGRVNINCVYYGGQIPNTYPVQGPHGEDNKYCTIRCLKDDRIQEGKQVSLDQCINCTRYEPLIGQVYDILTDSGDNLSAILDDNQMSYTTMDEYYKFRNLDERQTPMEAANLDAAGVQNRNVSEMDLDDEWGPGLAMDWNLYPVEMQQPHTNPPVEGMLSSGFGMNSGMALTNGGAQANMLVEARNQIDASDSNAKQAGTEYARARTDTIVSEVKAKLGSQIRDYYQSKNIAQQDTCLIASLMSVYGGDVAKTVDTFEKVKADLKGKGVDNIVLHTMFFSLDQKYLLGDGNDKDIPVRLDKVKKKIDTTVKEKDPDTGTATDKPISGAATIMPENAWSNVAQWNWNNISEPLAINLGADKNKLPEAMLNFAKVVYLYKELVGKCSASRFDTAEWGFPFTEEQITGSLGLNFSSGFKMRWGRMHNGIDIGVGSGASAKDPGSNKGAEIHAARDGVVNAVYGIDGNGGGNRVYITHDNGYTSWYMHMSRTAVSVNQKVNRGDVIGYTGGTGATGPGVYDEHLHFEIHQPGEVAQDPLQYYNGITMANEGSQLSAINV